MILKRSHGVLGYLIVCAALCFTGGSIASEAEARLTLVPKQCVALTQGQTCYVDVLLNWSSTTKGNYCLFSTQQSQPLICWQNENKGQYSQEFESDKNVVYTLKLKGSDRDRATQLLKVTWVHQKRGQPRQRWRIF